MSDSRPRCPNCASDDVLKTVRAVACEAMVALLLAGTLPGCSISPERQEALRRAWAEGEAEQAQDCQRHGFRYTAGVCTGAGGGP
jgi:hypothetical protein